MSKTVQIEHNSNIELLHKQLHIDVPQDVSIYSIEGPFFFGAIETFQSKLSSVNKDIHTIIIRLHHVPFIDVSAIDSLRFFVASLKEKNVNVVFCEANELVCFRMQKSRLDDACHDNLFSKSLTEAIETLHHVNT